MAKQEKNHYYDEGWKQRMLDAQKKWTDKDIDAINKQLLHYFRVASSSIIKEFEAKWEPSVVSQYIIETLI